MAAVNSLIILCRDKNRQGVFFASDVCVFLFQFTLFTTSSRERVPVLGPN